LTRVDGRGDKGIQKVKVPGQALKGNSDGEKFEPNGGEKSFSLPPTKEKKTGRGGGKSGKVYDKFGH